jgi:NAD(P)-dependent dehydrogenase (short-subunit alcohol dehydrogenase family)
MTTPGIPLHKITRAILLTTYILQTRSFGIFQQPSGLSPRQITALAQKRYQTTNPFPMEGKVAVITGAANGIGQQLCRVVHSLGAKVIALDRNETGLHLLRQSLDDRVTCLPTDHRDLNSVSKACDRIVSQFPLIDLLVNNAGLTHGEGCILGSDEMKSAHGKDLAFTVNYLSHFLLVERLMPCLKQSEYGRIVHMTSSYHWKVDGSELIPVERIKGPLAYQSDPTVMSERHVERSYANTKLAQIWHSREITGCESVCACVSLHPGPFFISKVSHSLTSLHISADMGSYRHSRRIQTILPPTSRFPRKRCRNILCIKCHVSFSHRIRRRFERRTILRGQFSNIGIYPLERIVE